MDTIRIADIVGDLALGASRGAVVFERCVELLERGETGTVILSFERVEATNGSFIKATLLSLLWCGKLSLDSESGFATSIAPGRPIPLDCYVVVTRCVPDVLAEIDEVCFQRGRNYLLGNGPDTNPLYEGELRGALDDYLRETYVQFAPGEELSAAELRRRHPSKVAGTVWNNRLAALHAMRLIKRRRVGREWVFSTILERSKIWENGGYAKKLTEVK